VPGLGASFGRGAATNYQQDLANSDCVLFMGSNMAEAHPVAFRWPLKAKDHGAVLIHVDPRFTRTSALCDVHVGIRAGSDIAFLGGLVNYVLTHDRWFKEYVLHYTNAATLVEEGFGDTEDLDGLFSGYHGNGQTGHYHAMEGRWGYAGSEQPTPQDPDYGTPIYQMHRQALGMHGHSLDAGPSAHPGQRQAMTRCDEPAPPRDPTLQDPRCVFQILKRHFERYTPEMVAQVCGCAPEEMVRVAELLCANSGRERTTAIVYALGWTQHTTGVQMIRTASILQLLLGNMGRPGGGIMAMRGHSTIQGSTDIATLYDSLPGYLPQPAADLAHEHLDSYVEHEGQCTGYWANFRKFIVSLLKAWYGDAATPDNEFGFSWIPRPDGDYSQLPYFQRMVDGGVKGYFLFGQNPAGGGPNARLHRAGLRNLDWLVVVDWFEIESAVFWKDDPNGPPPAEVKTEVFLLPSAAAPEKDGSLTNTQRMLQWHDKALDPLEDSRSDAWFIYHLGKRLKQLYAGSTDPRDRPLLSLTWDYEFDEPFRLPDGTISRIADEPDVEKVLMEINGYRLDQIDPRTGRPRLLPGYSELEDDGTTACGCWIYSGVYPEPGHNRARDRKLGANPIQPDWGWAWPHNRRIFYNRASADPEGRPWSERKKLVWWDAASRRWVGDDEPDFELEKPPDYRPPKGATGMDGIAGDQPFIMKPDGVGWLFAPGGIRDGPLPTHYEPVESPARNLLYPDQSTNPTVRFFEGPLNRVDYTPTDGHPVVATTYRLTEHYLSGPMSRFNSWLNELMPEMFVELSPELAAERGIVHGGWLTVESARGRIEARAMVTRRLRPLLVEGAVMHQSGLPFHWGFAGEVVGDNANDITALLADPNVSMHEAKAFACQVYAGRSGGPFPKPTKAPALWPTHERVPDTPAAAQPEGKFHNGKSAADVVPRDGRKAGDGVTARARDGSDGGRPR
jgi:formate dehydrogenase major subunit